MKAVVIVIVLAFVPAACGASPAATTVASSGASPSAAASPSAVASVDASTVPPGLIAYMRVDTGDLERYYTVDPLGENEQLLFETQFCACIRWSADGTQIWTVTETEKGLRYTTMDPDGSNKQVHTPDIETLSLAPGFGSRDGRHVAFFGWDDTDASRVGLWAAGTDLTDLHQVTPIPEGVVGIDPIGMSGDGSYIYFHGDTGPSSENDFHHAGNVYVIAADGTGMRQLNPPGTLTEITGTGLSADGGRLAFTAWQVGKADQGNALFIVDGHAGDAAPVTPWTVDLWGAAWAPTGDLIATTQPSPGGLAASVVKPDGTGLRTVSPDGGAGAGYGPVWSPSGTHFLVRVGDPQRADLWVMDLEGNLIWQVTHLPGRYNIYAWSATGG